jgi:hypothetical protein
MSPNFDNSNRVCNAAAKAPKTVPSTSMLAMGSNTTGHRNQEVRGGGVADRRYVWDEDFFKSATTMAMVVWVNAWFLGVTGSSSSMS